MTIQVMETPFGTDGKSGKVVHLYTFTSDGVPVCEIMSYGATLLSFYVPNTEGKVATPQKSQDDVVYGYDNLEPFTAADTPYYGATVGRVANRIARGDIDLTAIDGPNAKYHLTTKSNGEFSHHGGGANAIHRKVFDGTTGTCEVDGVPTAYVLLKIVSEDGEEGYPGKLFISVKYTLLKVNNSLRLLIDHESYLDENEQRSSVVNLTNHTYWNLAGNSPVNYEHALILNHRMAIESSHLLACTSQCMPQGVFAPLGPQSKYEEFDFKRDYFGSEGIAPLIMDGKKTEVPQLIKSYGLNKFGRVIGEKIEKQDSEQLKWGFGYDHCYALEKSADVKYIDSKCKVDMSKPTLAAVATCEVDKGQHRYLAVYTTHAGLHFYSGNWNGICDKGIKNPAKKGYAHLVTRKGPEYAPRSSFALEAQVYPDAIHHENFPSIVIRPKEKLHHQIVFEVGSL